MSLWLVVPVKSLAEGKSRLGAILNAAERRRFNEWLLSRTLGVAAEFPGKDYTVVVSGCQETLLFAQANGFKTLTETTAAGLNSALQQARDHVERKGGTDLLIVPCDLPLLDSGALRQLATNRTRGRVVIATDRSQRGTNALYLPLSVLFDFKFGDNSCHLHVLEARRHGIDAEVAHQSQLAFDVDTVQDYLDFLRLRRDREKIPPPATTPFDKGGV